MIANVHNSRSVVCRQSYLFPPNPSIAWPNTQAHTHTHGIRLAYAKILYQLIGGRDTNYLSLIDIIMCDYAHIVLCKDVECNFLRHVHSGLLRWRMEPCIQIYYTRAHTHDANELEHISNIWWFMNVITTNMIYHTSFHLCETIFLPHSYNQIGKNYYGHFLRTSELYLSLARYLKSSRSRWITAYRLK